MMTDMLGDMITRIRNAQKACHDTVVCKYSKLNFYVLQALERGGFIKGSVKKVNGIEVELKYEEGCGVIRRVERVSKPGYRKYIGVSGMERRGYTPETKVVSTSLGVLLEKEALEAGVGGEHLIRIS